VFCRDCGAANSADNKFCKDCGAKLGAGVKTMTLTVQDLEPVAGDANQERLTRLLDMAFWHNDAGNVDAAIKASESALVINPASTTAHSLLATLYEKKGDDERAIAHLEAVLDINPDSVADQTKLEQLRRGIHVKAIAPPPAYRWIPPALASMGNSNFKIQLDSLVDRKVGNVRVLPLVYSGLATALVLGLGLAAIRTQDKSIAATPSTPISDTRIASLPQSSPMTTLSPQLSQPYVSAPASAAPASPATRAAKPSQKDLAQTPDVFSSGQDDPYARQIIDNAAARVTGVSNRLTSRPRFANDGGTNAKPLPPLKVVPLPTTTIAPAPVDVSKPLVSTENLPRHTVVVSQLGQGQSNSQASNSDPAPAQPAPSSDTSNSSQSPGLVPVVRVTVHDGSATHNTDLNRGSAPANVPAVNNDEAQAYQDYALSLQQQGDYRGAKAAYERAIRTYKARLRSGHDSDEVERGLKACQTGLEICQQSQ
jgi:tetratricopeptide (TPR) repeat protein